jgi:L-fuculokinase
MTTPLIAIFDVGKTHAKLTLVDPALGSEIWSTRRANQLVKGDVCQCLDVLGIEEWLYEALASAPERERITNIVPVAHGAAAVLVDADGKLLVAPDYEDACYETVAEEYAPLRDEFRATYSPALPLGLNLGRQLFFLERRHPDLFAHAARVLLYPQYWAWRLCGVPATELTSLGTHTDLWRPGEHEYSHLARRRVWTRLFPSIRSASERLGPVSPSVVERSGLDARCQVACGIHDSNASYLRFLINREREAFTVVSSGTWTVVMANRGELARLREARDMLANVDIYGSPVATARYMGGREYETIAQTTEQPSAEALAEVLRRGAMALPTFASGGPFGDREAQLIGVDGLNAAGRATVATLYSALMTGLLIESLGTAGEIFVDGPMARNQLFAPLLSAFLPVGTVKLYPAQGGTSWVMHLAGFATQASAAQLREVARVVATSKTAGLREYQSLWRQRLEEAS